MNSRLTIDLDGRVLESAEEYARKHNTSLGRLVEEYLATLASQKKEAEITPLVKSLSGVIKLSGSVDYKEDYHRHLSEKYK